MIDQALIRLSETIGQNDRLLLAVSGGADSMAMLHLLSTSATLDRSRLSVVHVDHGLRHTSALDWAIVETYCKEAGVQATSVRVDVPAKASEEKLSIEHAARLLRYGALQKLSMENRANWILTAHTADDSFETVLLKMQDQAPWYEWTGIPRRRGMILRPFLDVRREELRKYVLHEQVPFRDDESNSDQRHRRNRLRSLICSNGSVFTNALFQDILKYSGLISGNMRNMRAIAENLLVGAGTEADSCFRLEKERILQYFNKLAFVPVEACWSRLSDIHDGRLTSIQRQQVQSVIQAGTPHSILDLPYGICLERRGQTLWLFRPITGQIDVLLEPGQMHSVQPGTSLRLVSAGSETDRHKGLWHVRNWKAGDRVKLPNRPRKKVSDLLCERKLSPLVRSRTLLLTHNHEPVLLVEPTPATYQFQLADNSLWELTCTRYG